MSFPHKKYKGNIPLVPMGVLVHGSAHVWPSARPPIDTSRFFSAHVSGRGGASPPRCPTCPTWWLAKTTTPNCRTKTNQFVSYIDIDPIRSERIRTIKYNNRTMTESYCNHCCSLLKKEFGSSCNFCDESFWTRTSFWEHGEEQHAE